MNTKWLDGKCYMLNASNGLWEELSKPLMEMWHRNAEADRKQEELQRRLNSD